MLDNIIILLGKEGPLSKAEIARKLELSPATAGKYVSILEAMGKVRVEPGKGMVQKVSLIKPLGSKKGSS